MPRLLKNQGCSQDFITVVASPGQSYLLVAFFVHRGGASRVANL